MHINSAARRPLQDLDEFSVLDLVDDESARRAFAVRLKGPCTPRSARRYTVLINVNNQVAQNPCFVQNKLLNQKFPLPPSIFLL